MEIQKLELELEAENYGWRVKRNEFSDPVKANELSKSSSNDFIAGATSNAAKEYWYKQFEEQKLQELSRSETTIKSDWDIRKCFKRLRFDKDFHLGMGDIRLTIGMQEEICELVERFYGCKETSE